MKNRGFTLIELVMVIVIIGILAAVAIPRFANLRRDAQQAACDGNLGALRGAIAAYYAKTAVSPGWTGSEGSTGFPPALTNDAFRNCFLMSSAVPDCPISGSAIYKTNYSTNTGAIARHGHP